MSANESMMVTDVEINKVSTFLHDVENFFSFMFVQFLTVKNPAGVTEG